jgi:hypothetical protein
MRIRKEMMYFLLAIVAILSAYYVYAAPQVAPNPPNALTILNSTRYVDYNTSIAVEAEAGNVSELIINDTRSTEAWQGYYGNITGQIVLADGSNAKFYSWDLLSPTGEVFAANASTGVIWDNVRCVNFSGPTKTYQNMNQSVLEDAYGINATDLDGFNETFDQVYTCGGSQPACIKVGTVTIPNNTCHMTTTYVNGATQTNSFKEILITDNASVIFTTIVESDVTGYDGRKHDFQMLVAENGHPGYEYTTTNWYFYVELA